MYIKLIYFSFKTLAKYIFLLYLCNVFKKILREIFRKYNKQKPLTEMKTKIILRAVIVIALVAMDVLILADLFSHPFSSISFACITATFFFNILVATPFFIAE